MRLRSTTLHHLPEGTAQPSYNRDTLKPGILHLGVGAFHRAHQAYFTDRYLAEFGGDWGIVGGDLRSGRVRDQLDPQDGLYSLVIRDNDQAHIQIMGALIAELVGPDDPHYAIDLMADEQIKIVSLTVTEKGYCHDPATGNLNLEHPEIQYDIANLHTPKSTPGFIVAGLRKRKEKGLKSFTLLSCDNLPNNGDVLQKVILQFAEKVDSELAAWIRENTTFPCTMVDRIVPATTEDDKAWLEAKLGMRDEAMVIGEPFIQWVIEDKFCNDRPAWEKVGALLVDDVTVYEHMKLRLLNGSHSLLAYTGYLSGFNTINEVMAQPAFVNMCKIFMDREAGLVVEEPTGFDIQHYKQQLRDRFANSGLKHRTWQIAMDGSQKLPQRLLSSLRDQLGGEKQIDIICLAVAAWIRYVSGIDESGEAIDVRDPLANQLREICDAAKGDAKQMVSDIVGVEKIFGADLKSETQFIERTVYWLESIYAKGTLATVQENFG